MIGGGQSDGRERPGLVSDNGAIEIAVEVQSARRAATLAMIN